MAAAASAPARPSGNSANISPAIPPTRIDWRESGEVAAALCARDGMGGGAERVPVARRLGVDGFSSSRALPTKRERADLLLWRWRRCWCAAASGWRCWAPDRRRRMAAPCSTAWRCSWRADAGGGLPAVEPLPRHGQIVLIGDFLAPLDEIEAMVARFAAQRPQGHLLQVLDPGEETLPFAGRVRFEGLEARGADPDQPGRDGAGRLSSGARHREGLAAIAAPRGWSFATHRTDRPPHPRCSRSIAAIAAAGLERRWVAHAELSARSLSRRRGCCWASRRCRSCGGCCA